MVVNKEMKKMGKTWENQYIWPNPKLKIFKTCVMPLTNYGAEVMRPTKAETDEIDMLVNTALRKVIKVGHRTNTEFIRLLCNIMTYEEKSNLQAIHFTKRCLELETHRLPKIISSRLVEIAEQEKTTQDQVKKNQRKNPKKRTTRIRNLLTSKNGKL